MISKPQEWHVILQKNGKIVNLVIKSYLKTLNLLYRVDSELRDESVDYIVNMECNCNWK